MFYGVIDIDCQSSRYGFRRRNKVLIINKGFCLVLHKTLCCGCSLESRRRFDKKYLSIIIKYAPYLFFWVFIWLGGQYQPKMTEKDRENGINPLFMRCGPLLRAEGVLSLQRTAIEKLMTIKSVKKQKNKVDVN